MKTDYWVLMFILVSAIVWTVYSRKLTIQAALTGGALGLILFEGTGFTGVVMMAVFFLLATAATSWKRHFKEAYGLAEKNKGKRTTGQVLANAGAAGITALLIITWPKETDLFRLMMAASFAAATADTLSSELGNVYGRKYYNILTLKLDTRGLDGVVSIEGSALGLTGSLIIATIYNIGFGWNPYYLVIIIVSGTIGNLADSILGASLERRRLLNNDAVNFLNTMIAALAAMVMQFLF
ncbi:MAG: DUF92 domain-containing protein [Chitinophagaceae bacterium]